MNTIFSKYAPAIFSLLVLLLGGYQALQMAGYGLVPLLQFVALVATTVTTYFVPMLDARYGGWVKTGLEVVGVVATAVIPFIVDNHITRAQIVLVLIAIVKALATHFGVAIRQDPTIDARETPEGQVPSITGLAEADRALLSSMSHQTKLQVAAALQQDATTERDAVSLGDGLMVDEVKAPKAEHE